MEDERLGMPGGEYSRTDLFEGLDWHSKEIGCLQIGADSVVSGL